MANLTAKELTALEEQLNYEQMLVKKLRSYQLSATDPKISASCGKLADAHKRHFDTLMGYLY